MNLIQRYSCQLTKQCPEQSLEARGLRVTIGGQRVNDQGARVTRGHKVEDQGEDGEAAEECPDVPVTHHQIKPHLSHLPAAQTRQAPVCCGGAPPVSEIEMVNVN